MASAHRERLYELARRGAEIRLAQLRAELARLEAVLGPLRTGTPSDSRAVTGLAARPRRVWSLAQREAAAARMRTYWASRRHR